MRVQVDLSSHLGGTPSIVQVEMDPQPGADGAVVINGKYTLPIVKGVEFPIDSTSYILPINGGDVSSVSFAHLLASYPMFGTIYFNPLLTATSVDGLDLTATFKQYFPPAPDPVFFPTRAQTGRSSLLPEPGQMPTHTALLPANNLVTPSRPGVLISKEIDIGPYTLDDLGNPVGADEFLLYWKILDFSVTDDVSSSFGATAGLNTPAQRSVLEVDQEPSGFSAYISPDDGDHWCEAGLLEPVAFCAKTTKIRLAFTSTARSKIFLASFAVLF